jgi:hypothetical protein
MKSNKAKLERLCSARLTRCDQVVRHQNMPRLSSGKGFTSLHQLTLNTFKHVISQVKLINTNRFASYAKHAKVTHSTIDYYQASTTKYSLLSS